MTAQQTGKIAAVRILPTTAGVTQQTAKFRLPFRRLPLSKSHINRCYENTAPPLVESNSNFGHSRANNVSTSSILFNLRRSYSSRGIALAPSSTKPLPITSFDCDTPEAIIQDSEVTELNENDRTTSIVTVDEKIIPVVPAPYGGFFRLSNARRSICPLKLAPRSNGCADDEDDESACTMSSHETDSSCDDSDEESSSQSITRTNISTKNNRSIRFQSYVKVVEIPHRLSYTKKQRRRMWNNQKEIRENAKRNRIEYEYEGPEWQNAIEEDHYVVIGGQHVHPAHVIQRNQYSHTATTTSG